MDGGIHWSVSNRAYLTGVTRLTVLLFSALHLLDLAKVIFNAHIATAPAAGANSSAMNRLRLANYYLLWARESLKCSVASGGTLCDGEEHGGPHAEAEQLARAIADEEKYLSQGR